METVPTGEGKTEGGDVLRLVCGCGFELIERAIDVLVEHAKRHAVEAHGMCLGAEQIVASVTGGRHGAGRSQGSARREEER